MAANRFFARGILRRVGLIGALTLTLAGLAQAQNTRELAKNFVKPPEAAWPWVYWFWLNGNITKEGVTADLEAMKRAGVGGVLIMEVDQGAPVGPVDFVGPQWRELFKHVVAEAQRLGLEVNMNNDAGWNGSGGPWIKPEESMQRVVWTDTQVEGPRRFEEQLPAAKAEQGYYRDISVMAFPTPGAYRIANINVKAGYDIGAGGPASDAQLAPEMVIDREKIADLTKNMDQSGRLSWDVPAGKWTIVRFGHTSTGVVNAPAPASGRGLECDKLSKKGIEANFAGLMDKLFADVGSACGKTLVTTHIDSWENGAQNWTGGMREEFQKRRGYDMMPFLPTLTGRVVGGLEISERFLWDLRQTISEMILDNYAGHARTLAQKHGVKLSIEAYVAPCNELTYAGRADEPMGEFWTGTMSAFDTLKEMTSGGHTYGKRIIGAEAFTANDEERWRLTPADNKALGDQAFCNGINRFVFHRYAMQPWLNRVPGMTMGPWGQHYERTNTWWEFTPAWHTYLARCQYLLREGLFVADLCYLQPEDAPQTFVGHPKQPYDFDNCCAEVVMTRMKVKHGRIVLPDGMSYAALVMPDTRIMTPALLAKIKELVEAGATVVGPKPTKSPSLSDYPKCDQEVQKLADELYGDCDGKAVTEHKLGKGRVVWGVAPEKVLATTGLPPDFSGPDQWRYIHRATDDADIYFVSNPQPVVAQKACAFRISGRAAELWQPETGQIEPAPSTVEKDGRTSLVLTLGPSDSVFVVFGKNKAAKVDPILNVTREGKSLWSMNPAPVAVPIIVTSARYGVFNDSARTRDVKAKAQKIIDAGEYVFTVSRMAEGDDPAYGTVKTLELEYEFEGNKYTATGTDPETVSLIPALAADRLVGLHRGADGKLALETVRAGEYELSTAGGKTIKVNVPAMPSSREVEGPWQVQFPANWGAPERITLDKLISWSDSPEPGVKYFSGTATYSKSIDVPAELLGSGRRVYLDLGKVAVMADVKLNGKPLGVLWRPPFRVDVTKALKAGQNELEIKVVNLWINRMIGDEQLPEDSDRKPNGTLKAWPKWLQDGQPSPTGRFTFTSWRLWKKDEALQPSGLIGPVKLECVAVVPVE